MFQEEFDRQVENLLQKRYHEIAGETAEAFTQQLEPLRERLEVLYLPAPDLERGRLPFVIVVKSELVAAEQAMVLVEWEGKSGISKMYPREPRDFNTVDGINLPTGVAYVLVDIDRGKESINMTPNEALSRLEKENLSPLTIDEGIAIVTHYPEFLMKNNCFSLLASRYGGDKRVPAIWINGQKRANLGWCWAGNPHTWLGSASCRSRAGV
ncbi:MAG: DUF5701 family protein [Trueperaceae bacterium]